MPSQPALVPSSWGGLHHPSRMGGLMEIDGDVGGVRTVPPVRFAICWGRRLARGPTKRRARAIEVEDWP